MSIRGWDVSLTHAALAVWTPLHAGGADTHEGTNEVLTSHPLGVAVVQTFRALVLIWWGRGGDGGRPKVLKNETSGRAVCSCFYGVE